MARGGKNRVLARAVAQTIRCYGIMQVMSLNREKQKIAAHNYYVKNKDIMKRRAREWTRMNRKRVRHFLIGYKTFFGCAKCGLYDQRVLDCHHRGNKEIDLGSVAGKSWSLARVVLELMKCQILCANCHRIETVAG